MNILWLTWRDIKNPAGGGAERVAIEVAGKFAQNGTDVTIFTSSFKNAKPEETIKGVKIIRRGNLLTCRLFAFLYYMRNKNFDLVIDEINTIPFFTILYARKKTIPLIHQLAKEYWFTQTIWPISLLGYHLETFWLKLYKNRPTLALSKSTKTDLEKIGFNNVSIYRIGLDFKPQLITNKKNLILFIGRLIPAKNPQDAIKAFSIIHKIFPDYKLSIIGRGDKKYINLLKKMAIKLNVGSLAKFEGYVSKNKKINLLKKSKIILIPSVREGWGLVASEANATGCIPIAYNVPGLKDSIKNDANGILVNTPNQLAEASISILQNETKRAKMIRFGLKQSKKFSWDNCYQDIKSFILKHLPNNNSSKKRGNNFLAWILAITSIGALIRLVFAVTLPLDGFDETYDILISQKSIPQMLQATLNYYPPIWHLILNSLEKVSQNYIFLRLLPVILGAFSIVLIGYFSKKIFNYKTGILTALIFALSPTQIYYSASLRLYAFSIFISLLIFLSFLNFLKNNSIKSKFALLAAITVGNYTFYLFPILYICLAFYTFLDKNARKTKLKSFLIVFSISLMLTLPLFLYFLTIEKSIESALPAISILKLIAVPLTYSFPLNLAQATEFYPYLRFNPANLLLSFFSVFTLVILSQIIKNKEKNFILLIPLIGAPLITLIFSYTFASAFTLRSLLIFSIPYYLLIADLISKSKKLTTFYIILAVITVVSTFVFFFQKPIPPQQTFLLKNIQPPDLLIHTEITTFTYYSYLFPQFNHKAAIDSLYINIANKKSLNYLPIDINKISGKKFWLLEFPSSIHKEQVQQFKKEISKTHNQIYFQNFPESVLLKYEPKKI